ncbi:transmembrane protein [Achlya hypogyna]|uniref:Transmembrane protein n=1 Tax=Achlya hypogyna TaxID=1202772 RepID=A0A1V9ZTV5_ACHHY|nr:transmembrane protein [Achlya hypogyna]
MMEALPMHVSPTTFAPETPGAKRNFPPRGSGRGGSSGLPLFRNCSSVVPEYFSRVLDYRQMDLEATYYQMVTLCIAPSKVYKSAYYRKQTKNRWARDDPAFAVIQIIFLFVASLAWTVAFEKTSSLGFLLLCDVVVEWFVLGVVISTITWWAANTFLRLTPPGALTSDTFFVEQAVEWQYAFDIHCNAFFVLFLIVHVLQVVVLALVPLLVGDSFLALIAANTLYAIACGGYFYITFLGYMALPFLHNTERFLYPVVGVGGLYLSTLVLSLLLGANFNVAAMSASYYYYT